MASTRENTSTAGERSWSVLFRLGKTQTSRTFETPRAAEKFEALVNALGAEKALAALAAPAGGLTVDELFEKWIEWKSDTDVTERTVKDYRRDYDNWIRSRLGGRPAASVDEMDVQQWVDWMAKRLDPKSVGDRHAILGGMYRYGIARTRRLVEHNPCTETMLPSKKRKAPKGFTLAQWQAMHAWAAQHEPDAADLLLFLASTGWRFSEATPLTPSAVEDHHGDQLFVSVLGVHRRDAEDRVVYVDGEAKSQAGVRRINLPPAAAAMVRRRLVGKGPADLLFTNPRGGRWHANNFLEREFARILAGAGIAKTRGMGPHYLRHTHVLMLDRAGVSLPKMQRRIGHEDIQTTLNVYGGMIDNTLSVDELRALDDLLGEPDAGHQVVAGQVVLELNSPAELD